MTMVTFADSRFPQMSGIYAGSPERGKLSLQMGGCVHWPKADVLNGARVQFPANCPSPEPGRLPKYRPTPPRERLKELLHQQHEALRFPTRVAHNGS